MKSNFCCTEKKNKSCVVKWCSVMIMMSMSELLASLLIDGPHCLWPSSTAAADRFPEIKLCAPEYQHQRLFRTGITQNRHHRSPVSQSFQCSALSSSSDLPSSSCHWGRMHQGMHCHSYHWANCRRWPVHCRSPGASCRLCLHWSSSSRSSSFARSSPSSSSSIAPALRPCRTRSRRPLSRPRSWAESGRSTWRGCSECSAVGRGERLRNKGISVSIF